MSTVVPIIEIKDKLCQKCVIPTTLIKDCNFKIGQFVILETNFRKLICKINFTSLPTKEVFVDSIISLPLSDEKNSKIQETLIFPDNIYPSEIQALDSVMINIGIPTVSQRKEIFQVLTKAYCDEIDCKKLALMTPGFIGSDISLLIAEAVNSKNANSSKSKPLLTTEDIEKVLVNMSPSVLKSSLWNLKVKPIYWKDIGGMFKVKERLQKCIELPLRNPEIFKKVDLPCPHGILLFGPPGCCKTTLARGLATECNANFFAANPAQIYSPYVGESEKNIVALFYQARLCAPSIVFLDEIDSLVGKREFGSKTQGVGERVLSALLNEMDGFGTTVEFQSNFNLQKVLTTGSYSSDDEENDLEFLENKVIVVAATNRPDLIDDALLRPGRFDTILYVPPPNQEERESILKTLTQNVPLRNVDLKKIAQQTEDFSGADIKRLCSQAAICTLRHDRAAQYITEDNFNEVLEKMQPSINKKQIRMYEDLSRKYGPIIK